MAKKSKTNSFLDTNSEAQPGQGSRQQPRLGGLLRHPAGVEQPHDRTEKDRCAQGDKPGKRPPQHRRRLLREGLPRAKDKSTLGDKKRRQGEERQGRGQ